MASGDDLGRHMPAVAKILWGEPRKGGTKTEVRFGEGRTINPQKGTWFDHNGGGNGEGGGVLALIERETGRTVEGGEAAAWMKEQGFPIEDSRPAQSDSNRNFQPQKDRSEKSRFVPRDKRLAKTFDYVDEEGRLLYQTLRYEFTNEDGKRDKTFSQRRPARPDDDPESVKDGWVYSLKGTRIVPYRLPELLEAIAAGFKVFFVEGEKCVDRLMELGVPSTCNPMGAGKWWDELTAFFNLADVVIIPDNDPQKTDKEGRPKFHPDGRPIFAGWDHAVAVFRKLRPAASKVGVLVLPDLPIKGDVWDWIDAGGTAERLYELAAVETKAPDLPVFHSKFGAVWFHEVGKQKPSRDWLVKNLILAKSFGIIYGPPGCGKSFLTSDLMLTCAAAALNSAERPDWFGYRGRPFGVIYVVAEGREDFEIRLHAWRSEHDIPAGAVLPFVFLPTSIDMRSNDADTKKLAEEIAGISEIMQERCGVRVEMVVIDTVARALAGGNENASEVMGAFVINCGKLQELTGVAVAGVHHGGKEAGRGPRGHEALHGAADFEIEVSAATPDTPNLWTVRKLKAGPGGTTHRFRLRQTTVGEDADGDPITSCVVVSQQATDAAAGGEKPKGLKLRDPEKEFLTALADTIDRKGVMPPGDLPVAKGVVLVAKVDDVRALYMERLAATESGDEATVETRLRARWSRATKAMIKFKVIESSKPWLWFTGRQVQGMRVRGIAEDIPTYVEPESREIAPTDDDVTDLIGM